MISVKTNRPKGRLFFGGNDPLRKTTKLFFRAEELTDAAWWANQRTVQNTQSEGVLLMVEPQTPTMQCGRCLRRQIRVCVGEAGMVGPLLAQ